MVQITQQQLDIFKSIYTHDARVQALTLEEINEKGRDVEIDWNSLPVDNSPLEGKLISITPCQMAVGYVIFDAVCLAVGAVALRSSVRPQTVEAMATAVAPSLLQIEQIIARMAAPNASMMDRAKGVFSILKTIYSGGSLGMVFAAFVGSLTWWTAVLYGMTGLATIVVALATDGLAFAAEVVLLLASFGFLVSDVAKAVQACSLTPAPDPNPAPDPAPAPGTDPFPFEPLGGIRTPTGNYLTIVNAGGLFNPNVPLNTDRTVPGPWEKFTIVPIDPSLQTFALQTSGGYYLTAVNGGGMGGPDDASCPVHTDGTEISTWQKLSLVQQTDGTYVLVTQSGNCLTAVNGGGMLVGSQPVATDRRVVGPWETFTFEPVPFEPGPN